MAGLPPGPLRRLLARLQSRLLPRQPPLSPASRPGPPPMSRAEILARYRRLRQISKEQHEAVLDLIAADVLLDWARRLDLTVGKTVVLENDNELTLPEDLAIYLPRRGHLHPLERYARLARFAPGSDEAIVLAAMRQARFSLWRIERRHPTTGLILRDLLRGEEIWLVDEAMERNAPPGVEMAARLLQPENFAMTARWLCYRILGSLALCVLCALICRPPTSHKGAVAVTESHPCPNACCRSSRPASWSTRSCTPPIGSPSSLARVSNQRLARPVPSFPGASTAIISARFAICRPRDSR